MPDKKTPNLPSKTKNPSGKGRGNEKPTEKIITSPAKPNPTTKEPTKKK